MTDTVKENNIEWLTGQRTATVTLSQPKHINKVKSLAEKYEDVKIVYTNKDGSIVAKLPLKFIKISAPRQVSDEQREAARERFLARRDIENDSD